MRHCSAILFCVVHSVLKNQSFFYFPHAVCVFGWLDGCGCVCVCVRRVGVFAVRTHRNKHSEWWTHPAVSCHRERDSRQ